MNVHVNDFGPGNLGPLSSDFDIAYWTAAIAAELQCVADNTEVGNRNDQLFRSACTFFGIVKGGIGTQEEAEDLLIDAATDSGYANDEPEQMMATLDSAWTRATPRDLFKRGAKAKAQDDSSNSEAQEQVEGITIDQFLAFMPDHSFVFLPTRDSWVATSVNSRFPKMPMMDEHGKIISDAIGKPKLMKASEWLVKHQPIEQMTWAPGEPEIVKDRFMADGGWIEHKGIRCLNLYRPPSIRLSEGPFQVTQWLNHLHQIYPNDAQHIIHWLAHRVQKPGVKINHAIVCGGNPGIGKDTIFEPVKYAVGSWNFAEVGPKDLLESFNPHVKSVILRISEARDLGEISRYQFYDHMKTLIAAPPDVLRVNEKHKPQYYIPNVCGVIITTNYKTDGIYLPENDRRHYVAWSDSNMSDFPPVYWDNFYEWYRNGGLVSVAGYLSTLDISSFNPKAPPLLTPAFFDITSANRAPEEAELADAIDKLDNPDALTINQIKGVATQDLDFGAWIRDRKNRRAIPHRLEKCGYVLVTNPSVKDGLWIIKGERVAIYARKELGQPVRLSAARKLINTDQ